MVNIVKYVNLIILNKYEGEEIQFMVCERRGVAASPRFQKAQDWVKKSGISDGTYPQRPVTREEVWSMLHRASKLNK